MTLQRGLAVEEGKTRNVSWRPQLQHPLRRTHALEMGARLSSLSGRGATKIKSASSLSR